MREKLSNRVRSSRQRRGGRCGRGERGPVCPHLGLQVSVPKPVPASASAPLSPPRPPRLSLRLCPCACVPTSVRAPLSPSAEHLCASTSVPAYLPAPLRPAAQLSFPANRKRNSTEASPQGPRVSPPSAEQVQPKLVSRLNNCGTHHNQDIDANAANVNTEHFHRLKNPGTSLVVQWLRIAFQCRGHQFDPWGTSLVAQWLRIRLPMQGTWVRALVREDPTCLGATKPMCHNY
ncbi:hypothetical protein J1605_004332 [Eschrichtius robustus]|uniref:Uncharacterized protein n=1 Tax=Eschrichtius robustus TaxID=9764 RepID=A0AB34HKQ1_ESCRO|nr:hypothetical protein J1605_004332 [Eschrichtius robustus]